MPSKHVEKRVLITFGTVIDGKVTQCEKRRRGTSIDGILGYTDDGFVIHLPTGRNIETPGISDLRKFVLHLLAADPEGWLASKKYKFGDALRPSLKERLKATRDSYPGD